MTAMTKEQLALRKRFYEDFGFYSKHALKVRTKAGEVKSFALNPVQQRFQKEVDDQRKRAGRVRKIILKGRQQGFSTYVSGRMYSRLSQRKAKKGLVVAHKAALPSPTTFTPDALCRSPSLTTTTRMRFDGHQEEV